MITVSMLHSADEKDLKRVFAWLTKSGMGRHFPGMPIGWYQCHQFKAIDCLVDKLTPYNPSPSDCLSVITEQFDNKYVYLIPCNVQGQQIGVAKRVVDTGYVFTCADNRIEK
jgi:hypothetical protein